MRLHLHVLVTSNAWVESEAFDTWSHMLPKSAVERMQELKLSKEPGNSASGVLRRQGCARRVGRAFGVTNVLSY